MLDDLSRHWRAYVLRGIVAIVFGTLACVWPRITLATFILLLGAYVLADGVFLIIKTISYRGNREDRWILLLEGLLGIGMGILALFAPGIVALGLLVYIVTWSLAMGILEIAAAIRLRKTIQRERWMILSSITSILLAVLLITFPGAGALGIIWLIAAYAIVFGILLIMLGFRLRGHQTQMQAAKP